MRRCSNYQRFLVTKQPDELWRWVLEWLIGGWAIASWRTILHHVGRAFFANVKNTLFVQT
jgi:hypothetical protein